jgi:mannobiose 2-epimerase
MPPDDWQPRLRRELAAELDAVARWWLRHVVDLEGGTIAGAVTADGRVIADAPLGLVYVARLLWFFSALAARSGAAAHRAAADLCHRRLEAFADARHGGLYWEIDASGRPLARKKQTYGQAFALYALAAYQRVSGRDEVLRQAAGLAALLEARALDPAAGGFVEALDEDWRPLADVRLGPTDLNADKTLNTHLHLLEAWTALCRVWPAAAPRLRDLLRLYLDRFVHPVDGAPPCFYTRDWAVLPSGHCPGHAIEASWLLWEAVAVLDDPALADVARPAVLGLADAVLATAVDAAGGVVSEIRDGRVIDARRTWWVQAEAMVGFLNAWQLGGAERFLRASRGCWAFIRAHQRQAAGGEWSWFSALDGPAAGTYLAGPWKGPYHNGRALLEMLRRLEAPQR